MTANDQTTARRPPTTFVRWLLIFTGIWAGFYAILIGLVGFALGVAMRQLVFPWMVLAQCGLGVSVLIWWGRSPIDKPLTSSTIKRFSIAFGLAMELYLVAVLVSGVLLGLSSKEKAELQYGPYVLPSAALIGFLEYFVLSRRLRRSALSTGQ